MPPSQATRFKQFATEFVFNYTWPDGSERTVWITRHSNHGNWIENDYWVVMVVLGPSNPWYLSNDGHWRYKYGHSFKSAEQAYAWLTHSHSLEETWAAKADYDIPKSDKKKAARKKAS